MAKKIIVLSVLLFFCWGAYAQLRIREKREVATATTTNTNFYTAKGKEQRPGTILYLEGEKRPGTLTVYVEFHDMENCNIGNGTRKYEVKHTPTQLTVIRPVEQFKSVGNKYGYRYRYRYSYLYGCVDHKPDTMFVYRLPCSMHKPIRATEAVNVLSVFQKSRGGEEKLGFRFAMEKGDTVYAMRRGIVTNIERPENSDGEMVFTTQSANILVEQPDGSMVGYNCLDRDNLFVSEGDEILPSTPLGLVGTYDGELYGVSVQNFWYITKSGTKNSEGREYATEYFFPRFATTEGIVVPEHDKIYTPVVTDEMMTCEMTRKERKEYLKNK